MTLLTDNGQSIDGLEWSNAWHIANGTDSYVVPLATLRPINIVFKGDEDFTYGHYGVHLGQVDRLIFLGPSKNTITAYFLDCRAESPTFRTRIRVEFTPSSKNILSIPPGVAHTFDTKAVVTLNWYSMLLPDPSAWLSGNSKWTIQGDIINVPMDISDHDIPALYLNKLAAADLFYGLIAEEQQQSLEGLTHEYPFTQDIQFEDGSNERLKFWRQLEERKKVEDWTPLSAIIGAGWKKNLVVWTGDVSGYLPLLDHRPKHLIDHGEAGYTHDAFGIHVGGDDHLLFIGPSNLTARCELIDCRAGSSTLHQSITFEFRPRVKDACNSSRCCSSF